MDPIQTWKIGMVVVVAVQYVSVLPLGHRRLRGRYEQPRLLFTDL